MDKPTKQTRESHKAALYLADVFQGGALENVFYALAADAKARTPMVAKALIQAVRSLTGC